MIEDNFDDYNAEELASLEKDELIEIIMTLREENDVLRGIKRSPTGEPVIADDEVVDDDEEVVT